MATMSKARKAVIAGGVVAGAMVIAWVALFGYWYVVDGRNPYGGHNSYGMRDYTPEVQEKAAQEIVAGLNTGNPDNVWLLRFHGNVQSDAKNALIRANITAVLPDPGCQYVLDGIQDKGEQDPAGAARWHQREHAWGFDMKLRQLCPGQQPTPRTVRVIATGPGEGGFWAESALKEQP
jgi:hypothetical protein